MFCNSILPDVGAELKVSIELRPAYLIPAGVSSRTLVVTCGRVGTPGPARPFPGSARARLAPAGLRPGLWVFACVAAELLRAIAIAASRPRPSAIAIRLWHAYPPCSPSGLPSPILSRPQTHLSSFCTDWSHRGLGALVSTAAGVSSS